MLWTEIIDADVVVVGSGPAGCAFAARAAQKVESIVIIERGAWLESSSTRSAAFPSRVADSFVPATEPFTSCAYAGSVSAVGGCSALNAGALIDDWDYWEGDWGERSPEWRTEAMQAAAKAVRQRLGVSDTKYDDTEAFTAACAEAGYEIREVVRETTTGVAGAPRTVFVGDERRFAARLLERRWVLANAEARRIVLDGERAVAVEVERFGLPVLVRAARIVVAAGAEGSTLLLFRSGLYQGVGACYRDHPTVAVPFVDLQRPTPRQSCYSGVAFAKDFQLSFCGQQLFVGIGRLFLGSSPLVPRLLRFVVNFGLWVAKMLHWTDGNEPVRVGAVLATVSRPATVAVLRYERDNLVLDKPTPLAMKDRDVLRRAVSAARDVVFRLTRRPILNRLVRLLMGGYVGTLWHSAGGVPRGIALAPTDLRVFGTANLHVVGAAAMPQLPRANPMASCYAMGWRLADILYDTDSPFSRSSTMVR